MKLKFILASLLINSNSINREYNYNPNSNNNENNYKINISDNNLYNTMIPKELQKECKNLNINIREILHNNYDDEKIYKIIAGQFIPKEIACFYLPGISTLLYFLSIGIFFNRTKSNEFFKENTSTKDIINIYITKYKILQNLIVVAMNIGLYMLIQNFRFNVMYMISICIFIIPLLSSVPAFIKILFSGTEGFTKEIKESLLKVFKEKKVKEYSLETNKHIEVGRLDDSTFEIVTKCLLLQEIFIWIIQFTYIIYFVYYINKTNLLQDKITSMKNNLNITKGVKKLNELQTQSIIENQQQQTNNYGSNYNI